MAKNKSKTFERHFHAAYPFGVAMLAMIKQRLIELGVPDEYQSLYLRTTGHDLMTASVPEGWSLLRISIDPTFPPGHPNHDPDKRGPGRPRKKASKEESDV